jgi:hypothetical protein
MKIAFGILLGLVLLFSSCEKDPKTLEVSFSVRENSMDAPSYSITYTSDISGSSAVASNNDEFWASSKLQLKQGQFVSLQTECTAPLYELVLCIYVNGQLWKKEEMQNPTTTFVLSGNLPAE